jgi:lipoprotein-anchoring transpeptidase ErfK/SrfK
MFAQRAPNASLDSGLSRTLKAAVLSSVIVLALTAAANGASLAAAAINTAEWRSTKEPPGKISPLIVKAQVLLARARFSPGEIDGKPGENYKKALRAYAEQNGGGGSEELSSELWQKLNATSTEPVTIEYAIAWEDVAGPFLRKLPKKMEAMQHLQRLSYTSARERIAEKFQMSEELLAALNPKRKFDEAGVTIAVLNVAAPKLPARVTRVQIDKDTQMLRAFGPDGALLAVYPVTAGSAEKPTPSETLKVTSINKNPTYRYNPAYAFKGVKSRKPFTINPGPNNPVGVVWIGLSSEGVGIHGSPEPGKISKSESHGCIRLTNWDALQLASALSKGVAVEFSGTGRDALAQSAARKEKAKPASR